MANLMRKMWSSEQVKEIVDEGIQQGEIQIDVNYKLLVDHLSMDGEGIDKSIFKINKLYGFMIHSNAYVDVFFMMFCVNIENNSVSFCGNAQIYDGNGSISFIASCEADNTQVTFSNDDGIIPISPDDKLSIYKL